MKARLTRPSSSWYAHCAACSRKWLQPPPQAVRPAADGLVLALRPSGLGLWCRRLLAGAGVGHALELLWSGHFLMAPTAALLAAALAWQLQIASRVQRRAPQRLVWAADGRWFLLLSGSPPLEMTLDASSLRLGRHLLLVLRRDARRQHWLLGPDNVPPAALAALLRRLPAGGGG